MKNIENKTLVFIPTYNESAYVSIITEQIRKEREDVDILFVDDASPDGTGKMIDALVEKYTYVHVVHRQGKEGIGSAHLVGIRWAYDKGYSHLITMDCDMGQSPKYLHEFFKYSDDFDVVIGSRYARSEGFKGWGLFRRILTKTGHFLTEFFLKLPYDATIAFRLYRLDRIPVNLFNLVQSRGYSFFFESLYILKFNGFKITEFPIHMTTRTFGQSKMGFDEILKSFRQFIHICWKSFWHKNKTFLYRENKV